MFSLSSVSRTMRAALFLSLLFSFNYALLALQNQYRHASPYSSTISVSNHHHQSYRRQQSIVNSIQVDDQKKVMLSDDFALVDKRLPWDQSIAPNRDLSYMPLLTHLLKLMRRNDMREVQLDKKFQYNESKVKPARIGNMCFESQQFRKIRVTYFDGGDSVQVESDTYSSLLSPHDCNRHSVGAECSVVSSLCLRPTRTGYRPHISGKE